MRRKLFPLLRKRYKPPIEQMIDGDATARCACGTTRKLTRGQTRLLILGLFPIRCAGCGLISVTKKMQETFDEAGRA